MNSDLEKLKKLKAEKNAIILAHYYAPAEVQDVADYLGDSFYLSRIAAKTDASTIVFAGVRFMAESAKLLNPDRLVLLPDAQSDCPMAHMATVDNIKKMRNAYPDIAVVCYINSTTELKAASDVCVTSSNAYKIIKKLPNKDIYFIPDQHLGYYLSTKIPEKTFHFNDGFCHVHSGILPMHVEAAKKAHPDSPFLVHPECPKTVLAEADFIGSTSEIIEYATTHNNHSYIIGTEEGIMNELKKKNPNKEFYSVRPDNICPNMKKNSIKKIIKVLEDNGPAITLDDMIINSADAALKKMLELAR